MGRTVSLRGKARIVTFRISGEEYQRVVSACLASGSRSLSEFARLAVLDKLQMLDAPNLTLNGDLSTLGKALGEVDIALTAAIKRIRRLLGPAVAAEKALVGHDVPSKHNDFLKALSDDINP